MECARATIWATIAAAPILMFTNLPMRTPAIIAAALIITTAVIIAYRNIDEITLGQDTLEEKSSPQTNRNSAPRPARGRRRKKNCKTDRYLNTFTTEPAAPTGISKTVG